MCVVIICPSTKVDPTHKNTRPAYTIKKIKAMRIIGLKIANKNWQVKFDFNKGIYISISIPIYIYTYQILLKYITQHIY